MSDYIDSNIAYWQQGLFDAPNPESCVFRTYGRILKHDFGLDGSGHENLLDFGCGPGGNTRFYRDKGFNVYGVDLSKIDIGRCQERMPEVADHFKIIDPKPHRTDVFFPNVQFKVAVAIQSLYYYSDADLEERMISIYDQMEKGGVFFATMMGSSCWYYEQSEPAHDGLRQVHLNRTTDKGRSGLQTTDHYVNFTNDADHLARKFHMFKRCHIGFYDYRYREDEGSELHWTFFGQKV